MAWHSLNFTDGEAKSKVRAVNSEIRMPKRLVQNSVAAEVTRLKLYGFLRIWSLLTSAATVLREALMSLFYSNGAILEGS